MVEQKVKQMNEELLKLATKAGHVKRYHTLCVSGDTVHK